MNLPKHGYVFTIPLTQGQQAVVDEKDWYRLTKWQWHACWAPNTRSYVARRNIKLPDGRRRLAYMHREVFDLQHCKDRHIHVDHHDHDTLNNCRANLRMVSTWKNHQNLKSPSTYGIGIEKMSGNRCKPYRARITLNKKTVNVGTFKTAAEAREARERKLRELGAK